MGKLDAYWINKSQESMCWVHKHIRQVVYVKDDKIGVLKLLPSWKIFYEHYPKQVNFFKEIYSKYEIENTLQLNKSKPKSFEVLNLSCVDSLFLCSLW